MRLHIFALVSVVLMAVLASASAADAVIDAIVASPDKFKVLLENDHVRVIEYELLPGQRDQWHTHPPKVSYVIAGGTIRITTEDGSSFDITEIAGTATWKNALGRHFAENIGSTPVRILLVEVKAAESIVPTVVNPGRLRP